VIVVDTNVLVYLCTESPYTAAAARWWQRDPEWWVPPLALLELANVLAGLVRRGSMEAGTALDACRIVQLRVKQTPAPDACAALATALQSGLSVYDAAFVVAARQLGARLVTHDRAMLAAAPDIALRLDE
jgi:predicted nucleic acid-binding protein